VVRDRNGDPRPELDPRELLRPCIYGQKEIYGIAQNAYARLELLDGFAADELRDVLEAERGALEAVQGNSRQITDTRRRIDDADDRLAELPNLEEWRARFREAGFEDLLRERRQLDREERLLARAGDALQNRIRQLRSMSSEGAPLAAAVTGGDEQLPNADLLEHAHDLLSNADESWQRGVLELEAALVDVDHRFAEVRTRWVERRKPREAEFDEALRQLQERMPDVDPERYLDVERRIEQLTPLRVARKQLRERLETLHSERSRLIVELDDARGKKHRARGRAAKPLNDALKGNVVSPGEPPDGVSPAAMRVGVSVRRNQMIVQRLVELGLVDAVGRGIVLLVEEAARLGLPEPAIDVPPGFTRVALHLAPEL
jgi:hypothetical protein